MPASSRISPTAFRSYRDWPAVEDEDDLVPVAAERVEQVFQNTQEAYVEKVDVEFLAQFAPYGCLGSLAEVDAPTQGVFRVRASRAAGGGTGARGAAGVVRSR